MKITMYELLGMVKDGKAPKKIKYDNMIWEYDDTYYMNEQTYLDYYCDLSRVLNDEVEIIEEKEEKKIPEKLNKQHFHKKQRPLANKINEIIDYLDYLKSKGE